MTSALLQWKSHAIALQGTVHSRTLKCFKQILYKIERNRKARRFFTWKFSQMVDGYPHMNKIMDVNMIKTLSQVSRDLKLDNEKARQKYKAQRKRQVLAKIFDYMEQQNPFREAFKAWKVATNEITSCQEQIKVSLAEKGDLVEQMDSLVKENTQLKNQRASVNECYSCKLLQDSKLEEISELPENPMMN